MATGTSESVDGGIASGGLLRNYAEAILDRSQDVVSARGALVEVLGEAATIQAAAIVASFDGINRVADATGIRLDPETASRGADMIIEALDFEALGAARA
jgi:hypothetical protein